MISCTKELILDGKNVKLDDLAIFSVGIVSRKGCRLGCRLYAGGQCERPEAPCTRHGQELSNAQINLEGQLKEAYKYNVDGSEPGSETNPAATAAREENPLG